MQHSMQVGLAQSRLVDSSNPLLHNLATLLQLEDLYTQVVRLCQDRLGNYIRVGHYIFDRACTNPC